MECLEKTVFLSYRRTNIPWAVAIFQNLTQNGFDVFFDYFDIASEDFERIMRYCQKLCIGDRRILVKMTGY
jgi:hypothetical protein